MVRPTGRPFVNSHYRRDFVGEEQVRRSPLKPSHKSNFPPELARARLVDLVRNDYALLGSPRLLRDGSSTAHVSMYIYMCVYIHLLFLPRDYERVTFRPSRPTLMSTFKFRSYRVSFRFHAGGGKASGRDTCEFYPSINTLRCIYMYIYVRVVKT